MDVAVFPNGAIDLNAQLLIIDDIFPNDFSPFRTIEYGHYLRFFNARALSTEGWHGFAGDTSFEDTLDNSPLDDEARSRVSLFRAVSQCVSAELAYITFLNNAAQHLPYLEAKKLPFILQLYPGGGMEVNQPAVDAKLGLVLHSPLLRKVITTQSFTRNYIIGEIGCDPEKVEHIYGGVFRLDDDFDFGSDKIFYKSGKGHDRHLLCCPSIRQRSLFQGL